MEFKNFFKKNIAEGEVATTPEIDDSSPEKLDNLVDQKIENLENKAKDIIKLIDEVGGSEGIEKTLKEIDTNQIEEIKKKMEECLEESRGYTEAIGSRLLATELPVAIAVATGFLLEYFGRQGLEAEAICSGILGSLALAPAVIVAATDACWHKTVGGIGFAVEALKYKHRYKKLEKEKNEMES